MSSITTNPRCVSCGEEIPVPKCEGCLQIGRRDQSAAHNQQEKIIEQTANSEQHGLIQQVDDWECYSINQIRQTANEARRRILKHTTERISEIEAKLFQLVGQLRQCRRDNNFVSKNASEWQEELLSVTKQLTTPANISVRKSTVPLVTEICVDILGKNVNPTG